MTEKLYYVNPYIKEFDATVISVCKCDDGFDVVLDKTAFFPEEGGQSSDTGYIADASVKQVYESIGVIHHICDTAPSLTDVKCRIDFEPRFEKMQCHTAEHILCGIIHKFFGLDNVGFHLGEDEVVFDVDGVLSREDLDRVEDLANEAVFSNVSVTAWFPDKNELSTVQYRAKLDLTDGVRLVKIGEYDICACCAPHVERTGEIGLIKILDFMKHRGGTRIWMVAGRRALVDYRARYENIKKISGLLSAPQSDVAEVLSDFVNENTRLKNNLKFSRLKIAELYAERVENTDSSAVFLLEDFTIPELIAFSNIACRKVSGICVALSGVDGDYKYVISSQSENLKALAPEINKALMGSGGGKPNMIQGSFASTIKDIKAYFNV